jgi:hypothetical protein
MENVEKRKHLRISTLNLSYLCLDEEDQVVKQGMGRTLNVSESGILLETYFPITNAHSVLMSIGLKDDLVENVKGRVVHTRAKGKDVYEVGIEFLDPDEKTLSTIRHYLKIHEKSQG